MVIAIKELAVYHRDGHRVSGILTKLILVDKDITLTPRGHLSISKDVNKICFDDYAHTVH